MLFAPTTYLGEPLVGIGVRTVEVVEERASNAGSIDSVLYDSVDSYTALRSFYLESRRGFVTEGASQELDVDYLDPEASQ